MRSVFVFIFFFICYNALSQNGKIIEQKLFSIDDSIVRSSPTMKQITAAVDFYRITYLSDGLKVKGFMTVPKKEGRYPAIIYNRGGNKEYGKLTEQRFAYLGRLSSEGYIVVASQYRGNDGGDGKEEFGGADVNDVLNLFPLLTNLPQVDTSRIGMYGWSRGGMMTYLALTRTNKIKAAVVGSGMADLIKSLDTRPEMDSVYRLNIPNYDKKNTELLKLRSAVYFAEKICKTTPILILQGTSDWRVPTEQVLDLVNEFYKIKQPFRFILYEGGQHSLLEHRVDFNQQLINWFHNYLRDRKPWPSLEPHGD